jgi:serine/threonine-protein kinase
LIARASATDPNARFQTAAELRDALREATSIDDAATAAPAPEPLTASPITAVVVGADTAATARATGVAVTSVLPVAAAAGAVVTPPPRTGEAPVTKRRRFRRAKPTYPKVAKAPKPLKPMKPPKPKRRAAKAAAASVAVGVPMASPKRERTWKLRHWVVTFAAPLLLVVAGVVVYAKLTESPPSKPVPDIVDRELFAAAGILHDAGFELEARWVDSPRPGGTILEQRPPPGQKLEEGSTVLMTISKTDALVPEVGTMDVEEAKVELRNVGLSAVVTPDYRDDVDPGTVTGSTPAAYMRARKTEPVQLLVATDPHVKVPNVVGLDQASATAQLQALGLEVAVQTASSSSRPVGQVGKSSPGSGATVVRGDTVTLTVSSGPKQLNVPVVLGWDRDDAISEIEDAGLAVNLLTTVVTSGGDVDTVVAQDPPGGKAAEGSTITITVGVRRK